MLQMSWINKCSWSANLFRQNPTFYMQTFLITLVLWSFTESQEVHTTFILKYDASMLWFLKYALICNKIELFYVTTAFLWFTLVGSLVLLEKYKLRTARYCSKIDF